MEQIKNVTITDMNENGMGIARIDGCIVFTEGAVTGDVCDIAITERKKNYALGKIEALPTPSPLRCDAGCPAYDKCGGCTLRHITFETENEVKRQAVVNAFRRAGLREVKVNDTLHTEAAAYRNKAVLHYGDGRFGYFSEKTNEVTDILPCPLLPRRFNDIGTFVNGLVPAMGGIGFRSLYLRTTVNGDISAVFGLETKKDTERLMKSSLIPSLVGEFPEIAGILAEVNGNTSLLYGERELTDELRGLRFIVSPEGFWQVNHTAAELLIEKVMGYAKEIEFDTGIDLYCGSGTFGLALANTLRDKKYYGVELNAKSIADAKRNAAANGVGNITFFCGDAAEFREKMDTSALGRCLVVIDPPRAGCSGEMLRNLAELGAEDVIYVSCSPNTLGRDCAKLCEAGYRVVEATPVNMFPRTKHCETVVRLRREKADDYVRISVHTKDLKTSMN